MVWTVLYPSKGGREDDLPEVLLRINDTDPAQPHVTELSLMNRVYFVILFSQHYM